LEPLLDIRTVVAAVTDYENRWALPDLHSALLWCRARNAQGIRTTLDILGESSDDKEKISSHTSSYLDLIKSRSSERLFTSVSIKLSALGSKVDREACIRNVLDIANEASARKVGFEIDMEGRSMVDLTIDAAKACRDLRYPVTLAFQAYLDRTAADLKAAIDLGIRVRLVKGAYAGDARDFLDIQGRFKNLARTLLYDGIPFSVGTHDPELIVWLTVKAAELPDRIEFGMLKGLSDMTKLDFVKNGWRISEYIPFGSNRAAYESRRRAYLTELEALSRAPAP
jgi:proline dehydrogenase